MIGNGLAVHQSVMKICDRWGALYVLTQQEAVSLTERNMLKTIDLLSRLISWPQIRATWSLCRHSDVLYCTARNRCFRWAQLVQVRRISVALSGYWRANNKSNITEYYCLRLADICHDLRHQLLKPQTCGHYMWLWHSATSTAFLCVDITITKKHSSYQRQTRSLWRHPETTGE